jgi:hypothetical protein
MDSGPVGVKDGPAFGDSALGFPASSRRNAVNLKPTRLAWLATVLLFVVASLQAAVEVPYLADEYDPPKWPEARLKLSQAGTLKDVFDSGLRPYRYPSLETRLVAGKHVRLNLELASGKQLPELPVEKFQITPFADGEIAMFEGFTPKLTLADARREMAKWLRYGTRTAADLDAYLKAVEADPFNFDDPYRGRPDGCGLGWKEPGWKQRGGGPKCDLGFRKTASESHPLRLYFHLSWDLNRTMKDTVYYQTPIPPPAGYEHVSMDAPKNFGPDSMVDILRAEGVDIGEAPRVQRGMDGATTAGRDIPEAASVSAKLAPAKPSGIWYLLLAIALAVTGVAVWRRFRKTEDRR